MSPDDFETPPERPLTLSSSTAVDQASLFLTFLTSGGNRFKTAAAHYVPVELVDELATLHGWEDKLRRRAGLAKDERKSDEEISRELQRLRLRTQAMRLSEEIDEALRRISALPEEQKMNFLFEVKKDGTRVPTGSFFVEMAKAAETCASIIYRASDDQLPQRPEAKSDDILPKGATVGIAAEVSKLAAAK